jgi:hypothetical protein
MWSVRGPFVVCWWFVVDVKWEGLPQLSPQAALGFDLLFNCSEVDITHTPNLAKIFQIIFVWNRGCGKSVR